MSTIKQTLADHETRLLAIPAAKDFQPAIDAVTTVANETSTQLATVDGKVALKADKSALDSLNTTVTGLTTALTENITAINADIAKKADKVSTETALALKADKSALATTDTAATALAVRVKAIEDVPTATTAEVISKSTSVRKFTPNMVYNAAAAVLVDQKAITEWSPTVTYGKGNIAMRNKSYFESNVTGNLNKDPAIDATGAWGPFTPGETNSLFFNRAPTKSDVYPVGTKWYDLSFGSDTPLVSLSLGNGAWGFLNEIKLAKIRFYGQGGANTYRSNMSNVKFFKPDGTAILNSWFVWGAFSGLWGQSAGTAYTGQAIQGQYNAGGWAEIECSSLFDSSITIGKITADFPTSTSWFGCSRIEFWYTNGSRKVFSGPGNQANAGIVLTTCDPAIICRYGDATSASQGVMLTAAQLSDPNDNTYGRISPAALNSAIQAIVSPTAKTPSQADFDALATRITELESRIV
jgi:hypothetical protein